MYTIREKFHESEMADGGDNGVRRRLDRQQPVVASNQNAAEKEMR